MTGGTVVVLGPTGRNFGAGMTNGLAYVLDEADAFPIRTNDESVALFRVEAAEDALRLRELLERHVALTGSARAKRILASWEAYRPRFWTVVPKAALEAAAAQAAEEEAAAKVAD